MNEISDPEYILIGLKLVLMVSGEGQKHPLRGAT